VIVGFKLGPAVLRDVGGGVGREVRKAEGCGVG
jgi:hypothetical protein